MHSVLLNLAKRVVADGEGASKFITINVVKSKTEEEAKKIAFQSPIRLWLKLLSQVMILIGVE